MAHCEYFALFIVSPSLLLTVDGMVSDYFTCTLFYIGNF